MQLKPRRKRARESAALRALSTSAVALSGLAGQAYADSPIEDFYTSYSYSTYAEDELDASKGLPNADSERYEVTTHQAILMAPITERIDFSLEVTHEKMSGASPWYSYPDAAGTPVQIMSGATIEDQRDDVLLHASYYLDNARLGFGGGWSSEKDYDAINFGFDGETHFNEKNTTLSGALGFSFDKIEPIEVELYPTRPESEDKQTYSLMLGLSQIVNRRSVLQTNLSYSYGTGYLSDPYKAVFDTSILETRPDQRPDTRHQFTWLTRYRRHVEEVEGTLHLSYQYYFDTWDVSSHTIELAWYQNFGDDMQITPSIRYYTQSESDFYVNYLTDGDPGGEYSSDFRLSTFGALSFGLKADYKFHTPWLVDLDWTAKAAIERYLSSYDLALSDSSAENPGLVSFTVMSVGLTVVF